MFHRIPILVLVVLLLSLSGNDDKTVAKNLKQGWDKFLTIIFDFKQLTPANC